MCSIKLSSALYRHCSIITALLRSANLLWIPFVVALFFENDCGGGWSLFWDPCHAYLDAVDGSTGGGEAALAVFFLFGWHGLVSYGSVAVMLMPHRCAFRGRTHRRRRVDELDRLDVNTGGRDLKESFILWSSS